MKEYILYILLVVALSFTGQLHLSAQSSRVLREISSAEITIYPNPATSGEFRVKGDFISEIEVLNLIGKSLIHNKVENPNQEEITIKIDKPERGYYLVKVTLRDNKSVVKKVLVQ